jgi:molybdopterin molybdotransferase
MNVRATLPALDDTKRTLLSPAAARGIVLAGMTSIVGSESLTINDAIGRIVATDVGSTVPLPRFNNSAVDGYGLHADDLTRPFLLTLTVSGAARAGETFANTLVPGQSVRLFTGSRIPAGVTAVIAQERTSQSRSIVTVTESIEAGANIRGAGEDVSPGTVIVPSGTRMDARHIAILAAAGVTRVTVRRRLKVGVLSTGSELAPNPTIESATIVDSNRPMLIAALRTAAIDLVDLGQVGDKTEAIADALLEASAHLDLILTTGGVGGSDTDLLHEAIRHNGGVSQTLRLALRPGKPLMTARLNACHVIGLPGNPIAALVTFLLFGRPAIAELLGTRAPTVAVLGRASERFDHKPGRTEFIPVSLFGHDDEGLPLLRKLGKGGSARLLPLVSADAFAELGAEQADVEAGALVRYYPFSSSFSL